MTLFEYLRANVPRWRDADPARTLVLRMDRAYFGIDRYTAHADSGMAIEMPDADDLLDLIATEFARGVGVVVAQRSDFGDRGKYKSTLEIRAGWLPCDIDTLRGWITLFNLTQTWDHVDMDQLKEPASCTPPSPIAPSTD